MLFLQYRITVYIQQTIYNELDSSFSSEKIRRVSLLSEPK